MPAKVILSAVIEMLAGIGLFLAGLNLFSGAMKRLGGPKMRKITKTLTHHDVGGFFGGFLFGAIASSAKAVLFACIGFVSSTLLTVRKVLPVLIGGSAGSAMIVLWGSMNFAKLELIVLGITGFLLHFGGSRRESIKLTASILLGFGLLLFGLGMLKGAAATMEQTGLVTEWIGAASGHLWADFLVGIAAGFVFQSAIAVSLVLIALSASGILATSDAAVLMLASNVGAALATLPLAASLKGETRQIAGFFTAFKIGGSLLVLVLFLFEHFSGIPAGIGAILRISADPALQLALLFLASEAAGVFVSVAGWIPLGRMVARLYPPTQEENLSRLQFLSELNLQDTSSALDLVAREQLRLLARTPAYFDQIREGVSAANQVPEESLHSANLAVAKEIDHYLGELLRCELTGAQKGRLIFLNEVQREVESIHRDLDALVRMIRACAKNVVPASLVSAISEGLHALIEETVSAMDSEEPEDLELLLQLTSDRSAMMDGLRNDLLGKDDLNLSDRNQIVDLLVHLDRAVWGLHQFGRILRRYLGQ